MPDCVSPQESLSSLSVESLETELLEQCISSGMPKPVPLTAIPTTKQQHSTNETRHRSKENKPSTVYDKQDNSKNVNAASVARNTNEQIEQHNVRPVIQTTVTGVDYAKREEGVARNASKAKTTEGTTPIILDTSQDKYSLTEERLVDQQKNGFNQQIVKIDDIELSIASNDGKENYVDDRMLDPDAMIESLDRFTAELVSQASHLQKKEDSKFGTSVTDDGTWNDDNTSPNDLTFPSISASAPNVITFPSDSDNRINITFDVIDGTNQNEQPSNDFSSINTSTLTESTLIAMEATKIATRLKEEADMTQSLTSVNSLELDNVPAPSELFSLSLNESPKPSRKKLPPSFMIKKVFTNSLNRTSSIESLENHSISNLDQMNPPSAMSDIFDMDGSMNSVASLINDNDIKPNFVTNGIVTKMPIVRHHHSATIMQQLLSKSTNCNYSISDLDHINPPSLLNDITDMCNSLADIPTDTICSQTEIFEDCRTHLTEEEEPKTEEDVTEFSEAHSETPVQSDFCSSSAESTPKRTKNIHKHLTPKQKRNLAKERYKTYTIAAEIVMKEENFKAAQEEQKKTEEDKTESYHTAAAASAATNNSVRITPKQRRKENRSRFETQILDATLTNETPSCSGKSSNNSDESFGNSPTMQSPAKTKSDIRKSFMQKRLENRDRFRTQTLSESSVSPDLSCGSPPLSINNDVHYMVQKEANAVLKTLSETKTKQDDLLDCETLSLVSMEDDSDHNSGCSINNYRTYHKSWGFSNNNVPVIDDNVEQREDEPKQKPKIVKPDDKKPQEEEEQPPQEKTIRGRRKLLYTRNNLSTTRTVNKQANLTSNLVKNVTTTLKNNNIQNNASKLNVKPPTGLQSQQQKRTLRQPTKTFSSLTTKTTTTKQLPSTTQTQKPTIKSPRQSPANSTKSSPIHSSKSSPKHQPQIEQIKRAPVERQGTFTKESSGTSTTTTTTTTTARSKIPTSSIPKPRSASSSSSTRQKTSGIPSRIQPPSSSKSITNLLKNQNLTTTKKPNQTNQQQQPAAPSTKQAASKIASLWKKIEESKAKQQHQQQQKPDSRVWIQPDIVRDTQQPRLIRSNTFENKNSLIGLNGVDQQHHRQENFNQYGDVNDSPEVSF